MRCIIPQITWHTREPVLSIDFDPSCKCEDGFYRLASGGADKQLLIWHIREPDTLKPNLLCVAELKRHQKTINVIRFSPDGNYIASADDDSFVFIWKNETKSEKEESWLQEKSLRRHLEDVSDLCWSPDGAYLVSGSVDNSAVMWDVKKGSSIYVWSEHVGFVNGVSYDPFNEFIVTMCIDRTLRFYNAKNGKLTHKLNKFPPPWLDETTSKHNGMDETTSKHNGMDETISKPNEEDEISVKQDAMKEVIENPTIGDKENENVNAEGPSVENVKKPQGQWNRLFCDADDTFCRRMAFSPKGELLMVPGGLLPPHFAKETLTTSSSMPNAEITPATSPCDGKSKGKKMRKVGEKPTVNNNAILVFCRNSMVTPCAVIPTGTSLSTVIRFNPVYYERSRTKFNYDSNFINPTLKSDRTTACVGRLKPPTKAKKFLMETPYRLVYAVATNDSIILGDTASFEPLAVVKNIHCTRMTDISWSADGRVCVCSSTDGYCSIITFEKNELGLEFPVEQVSSGVSDCFPIPPPKKLKPKKKKKEAKPKPAIVLSPKAKIVDKPIVEKAPVVEEEKEPEANQSPKPVVAKPVQKNNLLKWVIKKPKLEDEANCATEDIKNAGVKPDCPAQKSIKEPELICLDSNSCEVMETECQVKKIPTPLEVKMASPIMTLFKNHANRSEINQRELLKLQTAPIKNADLLEASIAENVHGIIPMDVDSVEKNGKTDTPVPVKKGEKCETAVNSESLAKADTSPFTQSKNSASPVSSSTSKPPRRIQLITLTGVAPKKEKGNLD